MRFRKFLKPYRTRGSSFREYTNNVEVYMSFTRKKLSFVGAKTKIKAVWGMGYELRWEDV